MNIESHKLLPYGRLEQILFGVSQLKSHTTLGQLIYEISVEQSVHINDSENSLHLLINIGALILDGEKVSLSPLITSTSETKQIVANMLMNWLAVENRLMEFAPSIQFVETSETCIVHRNLLPWSLNSIVTLMLDLDIFTREMISSTFWEISPKFAPEFIKSAASANEIQTSNKGTTKEEFKKKLERRNKRAEEAENWVLKFEKDRLEGHPLIEQIRKISDTDTGAGYDISSFSSTAKLVLDRFIDVKSYLGTERFFWSSNEINVAKTKGESYFLYLVDMEKYKEKGYKPRIISGPYTYFCESDQENWDREIDTYKFTRKKPEATTS